MEEDKNFSLWKTGLRSGEYIIGIQNIGKKNIGTKIQVRFINDGILPPFLGYFDSTDIKVRDRLNFGFFKDMNFEQRNRWIAEHSVNDKVYLSDLNVELRFISLGGEFLKLDSNDQNRLMTGEWIPMNEVFLMFPRKPGSNAKRHTLIFRGNIWALTNEEREDHIDMFYDPFNGSFMEHPIDGRRVCAIKVGEQTIGVCDNELTNYHEEPNPEIANHLSWLTPGILKSLLQKIIRMFPEKVEIEKKLFDSTDTAITVFLMLFNHPGSFVPDLKMFVKGAESALKRLAVTILEDSYGTPHAILSLFLGALMARKDWKFSPDFIHMSVSFLVEAMTPKCLDYDWHESRRKLQDYDQIICNALETLKSFETDINMLYSICGRGWNARTNFRKQPPVMKVEHCLDHHCTTGVLYFYRDYETKHDPKELIDKFWNKSSKFNPRKHNFEIDKFVKLAQKFYWRYKTAKPSLIPTTDQRFEFSRNISPSWISAMIGPIEHTIVTGGKETKVVSFFKPDDIGSVVTIRRPTRAKDEPELTKDEILLSSNVVERLKSEPFHLKEDIIAVDHNFRYDKNRFIMDHPERSCSMNWEEYCNEQISIPLLNGEVDHIFYRILRRLFRQVGDGIIVDWKDKLRNILSIRDQKVMHRLGIYIRRVSRKITMYKISRDGSGTYLEVGPEDFCVFRILCSLCDIFPGVIRLDHDNNHLDCSFDIINIFFWNRIRDEVFKICGEAQLFNWGVVSNDDRILKSHQVDAVERIIDRCKFGKRGSILYLSVGSGKTLIVIKSLLTLMSLGMLPRFVVYSMPAAAFDSVFREFSRNSIPFVTLDPRKGSSQHSVNKLTEFHVNFINHDHMRYDGIREQLVMNAVDIFMVFDEFHYMMSMETKRTSVGLEMAKSCNNFIALTGTLVKDKDPDGIIEWVSQVVEFELTKKNFLVGISSLISGKINYGITCHRQFIDIPMQNPDYFSVVDQRLGGTADRVDFRAAVSFCYDVIREEIVRMTLKTLQYEQTVFVVALNNEMMEFLSDIFTQQGYETFCIRAGNSITLEYGVQTSIRVVITTMRHCTGYTLTSCKTMITSVYFSNQASRTQIEGRLIRTGQQHPYVDFYILHTGILSYVLKNYEDARSIEKCINDMSRDI